MAEEQSKHRRAIEARVIDSDITNSKYGIWCAFGIGLATIIAACVGALKGYPGFGSFLGLGGLGSLVGTFIYGTRARRNELSQKAKMREKRR